MKTNHILSFLLTMVLGMNQWSLAQNTSATDSIGSWSEVAADSLGTSISLGEVTAIASHATVVKDGIAYRPTHQNKLTALDPMMMLKRMAISNLKLSGNDVYDNMGNRAAIYLDGKPATGMDIANLLPQDIEKVNVLTIPRDPKYRSAPLVVEFVTKKWIFGGYLKANGYQSILSNMGQYSLGGKFVNGKSTFQVLGSYQYLRYSGDCSETFEKYNLPQEEGKPMFDFSRHSVADGQKWYKNSPSAGVQWDYTPSKKVNMTLNLGFDHQDNFKQDSWGYNIDNGDMATKKEYTNHGSPCYSTYNIGYDLEAQLDSTTNLTVSAGMSYTTTDNDTEYKTNGQSFFNRTKEDGYSPTVNLNLSKELGRNNSFSAILSATESWYKLNYLGTADENFKTRESQYQLDLNYSHRFKVKSNTLSLRLSGNLPYNVIKRDGYKSLNSLDYTFRLSGSLNTGQIGYMYLSAMIGSIPRAIRYMLNPGQQETDITGKLGNMELKASSRGKIGFGYTWLASRVFNLSASFTHSQNNYPISRYIAVNDVVYSFMTNSGTEYQNYGLLSGSLQLLNGSMSLEGSLVVERTNHTGYLDFCYWNVIGSFSASYMTNSGFSASISYSTPQGKQYYQGSSMIAKDTNHTLSLSAGYTKSKWSVYAFVSPLYKRYNTTQMTNVSGVNILTHKSSKTAGARSIGISLRYILDFGRKYPHGDDMWINTRTASSL